VADESDLADVESLHQLAQVVSHAALVITCRWLLRRARGPRASNQERSRLARRVEGADARLNVISLARSVRVWTPKISAIWRLARGKKGASYEVASSKLSQQFEEAPHA
jgi:hypothetical protein